METLGGNRRWVYGLITLAAIAAVVFLVAVVALLAYYRDAADYPGALRLSEDNLVKFWPHFSIRRDTAYQTSAPFDEPYDFYSNGFDLGPEQHALGACSVMAASKTIAGFLETDMAVTLCDTPSGRLIFVKRSASLRLW
jgi:hypothetical protein